MGKSAVADWLTERGVPVIDTDQVARELVLPGQPALEEIRAAFGIAVLDEAGRLNRPKLAERVFADPTARRQLEQILHPRIRGIWTARVAGWRKAGQAQAVVVIPLLFEVGADRDVDCTVCVACSPATQRGRLRARGWTDTEIERRVAAQWPIADKMQRSDRVIWNEGSWAVLAAQVSRVFSVPA